MDDGSSEFALQSEYVAEWFASMERPQRRLLLKAWLDMVVPQDLDELVSVFAGSLSLQTTFPGAEFHSMVC